MRLKEISVEKTSEPILQIKRLLKNGEKNVSTTWREILFSNLSQEGQRDLGLQRTNWVSTHCFLFSQKKRQLLFSTSLKGLLSIHSVSTKMNEDFLAK